MKISLELLLEEILKEDPADLWVWSTHYRMPLITFVCFTELNLIIFTKKQKTHGDIIFNAVKENREISNWFNKKLKGDINDLFENADEYIVSGRIGINPEIERNKKIYVLCFWDSERLNNENFIYSVIKTFEKKLNIKIKYWSISDPSEKIFQRKKEFYHKTDRNKLKSAKLLKIKEIS